MYISIKGCTILTIAHRLQSIADYDRILVFEKGALVQEGEPMGLLVNQISDREVTAQGKFSDMVRNLGEKLAADVLDIARESYMKRIGQTSNNKI